MLDRLQPALLGLRLGGDDVRNRAFAGKRGGETTATTLNVDVVAVTRRLVVETSRVSIALLVLQGVLNGDTLDGGCFGVVVGDNLVALAGEVDGRVLAIQKRAKGNVPEPHPRVTLDKTASEVGNEEDVRHGKNAKEDAEDDATSLASTHFLERLAVWQLIDDEESKNTGGEGQVEGDQAQTPLERVLPLMYTKLDSQEEDSSKGSGDEGGNNPRSGNLGDGTLLPAPAKRRLSSNAGAREGSDNRLCGGNRHTGNGGDGQEGSRTDLGAAHGKHQSGRRRLESVEGKDATLDGACDTGAQSNSTQEFGNRGEDTGLPHLQGPGGDRSGVRVGDIVGAVGGRREDKGDGGNGKDPVVLLQGGSHG